MIRVDGQASKRQMEIKHEGMFIKIRSISLVILGFFIGGLRVNLSFVTETTVTMSNVYS